MLPVFGPSDKRDAVGLVGDTSLANPMTYFFPYEFISSAGTANNLTDSVEGFVRFSRSEADSYSILQYAWSFAHENRKARYVCDWKPGRSVAGNARIRPFHI